MSEIKKTDLLEKLKDISENGEIVRYKVYAFLPKRKRVNYSGNVYRMELQHARTAVYTTTDLDEAKQVFNEYESFYPAIEATIYFR